MKKTEYVCKIDGKQFSSEQSLIDYIKTTYIKQIDVEEGLEKEEETLKQAFPGFLINMEKQDEEIFVEMSLKGVEGSIDFKIKEKDPNEWRKAYKSFEKIEDAIEVFTAFFQKANLAMSAVYFKIKEYEPDIKEVRLKSFHYGGEVADDDCYVTPIAIFEDKEMDLEAIRFDVEDCMDQEAFDDAMRRHARSVDADYIMEIEGEVERVSAVDYYEGDWFEIDGININSLAHRAKRLYVKIIEEK